MLLVLVSHVERNFTSHEEKERVEATLAAVRKKYDGSVSPRLNELVVELAESFGITAEL